MASTVPVTVLPATVAPAAATEIPVAAGPTWLSATVTPG
jgi:hypothetical protein